jgi:hypothetical protein
MGRVRDTLTIKIKAGVEGLLERLLVQSFHGELWIKN